MDKVVTMFPDKVVIKNESPTELLTRMIPISLLADKAVVILISDRAGTWNVEFHNAQMNNSEVVISLEIVKEVIINSILGKG